MPRDILNDGGLFNLIGELQHRVQGVSGGERDVLDDTRDDQQGVGVEQVHMLITEEDEERSADRDGWHQVRQERDVVYVIRPLRAAVLRYGVADQGADRTGDERTDDGEEQGALEGVPDGRIIEDAVLTIHTVLADIFVRQPPLRGEVRGIVCIQEAVVARVRQEGLQCEEEDRPDGGEEGQQDEDHAHDVLPGFSEIDLTELSGFTGDGRVVRTTGDGGLVETQDQDAEEHHDDREDAGFTGVLRVQ